MMRRWFGVGGSGCHTCPEGGLISLEPMGGDEVIVALAGNPNTGKSSVFNALTGLKQHTGNWPGKTVARAEGFFSHEETRFRLIDLPGTYSLRATSTDEEIARDFILFGQPACTVVVLDATSLERNLNLALQVLEITDRVVICLNLMDEARRKGIQIDIPRLEKALGVPVVPTVAIKREGLSELKEKIHAVASGEIETHPPTLKTGAEYERRVAELVPLIEEAYPELPNVRWIAMRLLDGDKSVQDAILNGEIGGELRDDAPPSVSPMTIIERAEALRASLDDAARDEVVYKIYIQAEEIARNVVHVMGAGRLRLTERLDRAITSPIFGLPLMGLGLAAVFWLTVTGANYPSELLARGLFWLEAAGSELFTSMGVPWWVTGFLWHGVYRALAWVVSVMLPPMAIFFPIFTILEDFGLLPRIAFNMDRLFQKVGAHGKMALTMSMGFGCNAAGVTACRVIDSPRERLIAILTNNFVPCNGRFPTLIMLATIFVAASVPAGFASFAAAGAVVGVTVLGIAVTLVVSWALSRTVLRGEASFFTLELPAYRRPRILQTLYTSLIDRTLFVLYRAVMMAMPAGAVIWILSAIKVAERPLSAWIAGGLDPLGRLMGLDGVILFGYIAAIPANEIVVPTIIMTYLGANMMTEFESLSELKALFVDQNGWTLLTAMNMMLFSLLHNPCSTTIWTMWKETRSKRWTTLGALMPLAIGFVVTITVAAVVRFFQ